MTLTVDTPATPGDSSGAIVLSTDQAARASDASTTIPVTLRSLIPNGSRRSRGT